MLLFGIAAATLAADQLAKVAARAVLGPGTSVSLLGSWFQLTLVHNTGSAFGLIQARWALVAVGGVVCVAVLAYVMAGRVETSPGQALPLGLVLGGSLGNLLDRIRTGGVTDFFDLRVWPVFNLADAGITIGIVLLALGLVRRHPPDGR